MNSKILPSVLAFVLLFVFPGNILCQIISGTVLSTVKGEAIPNANISIYEISGTSPVGYGFSAKDGSFTVKPNKVLNGFVLQVTSLGYTKYERQFSTFPDEPLKILLEAGDIKLKEVKVIAPKVLVNKDTVNYTTAAFVREQDRSIGDVLKRIPGLTVSKSGQVTYKEKPINALYIDNKNLLDGQYGIATQNIKPDLVSMIQIFENHQPIKVLEKFTASENAAINLKLRNDVKSEWISYLDLGAGAKPFLWNTRAMLFQFAKKFQSMNLIKSNNQGKDISQELVQQNLGLASETQLLFPEWFNVVDVTGAAVPPVGEERNMFNKSLLVSSSNLFSLNKNLQAVIKLNYLYDFQERDQSERTQYLINGGNNIVIEEKNKYRGYINSPELDFMLKSNTSGYFLQNRINVRMKFCDNYTDTRSGVFIKQKAKLRQYDVSEVLSYIKPVEKSILKVYSNTNFRSLPQTLTIGMRYAEQNVVYNQLQSENKVGMQRTYGGFSTDLTAGANFSLQNMDADMVHNQMYNNIMQTNDLDWSFTELFFNPQVKYESKYWNMRVETPAKILNGRFRFSPSIYLKYKFNPFWEGCFSYIHNTTHTDILNKNEELMMVNYRSFTKGYKEMLMGRYNTFSLSGQYNNPLKLFSLYGSVNYNRNVDGYVISVNYTDINNIRTILPDNREHSATIFTLNTAKSFFLLPVLLELKSSCSIFDNSIIQQGKDTYYKTYLYEIKPRVEVKLHNRLTMDFNLDVSMTERKRKGTDDFSESIDSYNPSLLIGYKIGSSLRIRVKVDEYINDLSNGNSVNCVFTDAGASLKLGKGEMSIDCTNIFNKHEYSYKYFSEMATIDRTFKLRPFNIMLSYSFTL